MSPTSCWAKQSKLPASNIPYIPDGARYSTVENEWLAIQMSDSLSYYLMGLPFTNLFGPRSAAVAPLHEGCQRPDHTVVFGFTAF